MAARSSEAMTKVANTDLVRVQGGYVLMTSLPHARSGHLSHIGMNICRRW